MRPGVARLRVLCVVAVISTAQVAATQLTRLVQFDFRGPCHVLWAHAALQALCWPLAWPLAACLTRADAHDAGENAAPKRGTRRFSPALVCGFCALFAAANYCYIKALVLAPASVVQTVFGAAPAAVVMLSRPVLGEALTVRRAAAAAGSLAGVALTSSAAWSGRGRRLLLGVALALVAVLCAATYKVAFRRRFGATSSAEALRFVGVVGAACALVGLPVVAVLEVLGLEDGVGGRSFRFWLLLLGGGLVDVIYNAAIAVGLSLAPPAIIALGTMLAIPLNVVIDALLNGVRLTPPQLGGAACIVASFALLALEPSDADAPDEDAAACDEAGAPFVDSPFAAMEDDGA
mmetsp:Transcript_6787/g.21932  ORF Transcript_6787/g.21932 Transcript_6787/m.21932 type:complete len:348 (-) Transcript_6787:28-1071(-)